MKKEFIILFLTILTVSFTSAICSLDATLVNQDPYPAIPGEYVDVVFQLTGLENPECGEVSFRVVENFPFSLDEGTQNKITVESSTHTQEFKPFLLAPYKLKVDKNSLDGKNPIKVKYAKNGLDEKSNFQEKFNITIEDARVDFEIHIEDYSQQTKELTLEILNTGKYDVEAVTLEIPEQENIKIIGSNRQIIGDIYSNEDDRAIIKAITKEGKIKLDILYIDKIGERRKVQKEVYFNPKNFEPIEEESKLSPTLALIIGILIPIIIYFVYNWNKKRKNKR